MEDTQVINWELEEEEETEGPSEPLGHSLEPVGRLRFFSSPQAPEKDFPLYLGKNVVGRLPDCTVALPFPSISKQHAVIEILAWNKAPILRDCGSLNGTQILRPPKVLKHGMSHRLRDQELILFGDLPCQYYRLDVPKPFVCRGPLTVEETPRVQRAQPQELLLAEDSEEEVDPTFEEPKTTSSPLTTVVPESDEEGGLPAPDGPFAFNLDSDTDEETKPPVSGGDSLIARRDAIAETEQSKANGTMAESQTAKDPCAVKRKSHSSKAERGPGRERSQAADEDSDTDVDDKSIGRLAGDHLEMTRSSGFMDSDTDVEEEGIPATPAVVPVKQRLVIYGVGTKSSGAPDLAHRQDSDSDTDVEESKAPLPAPLERSLGSMEIDNKKDDKEEISTALPLVSLKESPEGSSAQPVGLLEQNQTSTRRGGDTDMKEQGLPVEKQGRVLSKGHPDKAHPEKSQPLLGDSDRKVDISSAGVQLEGNQASATEVINKQVEEKYQVPVVWTNQRDVKTEGDPRKVPGVHPEIAQSTTGVCETHAKKGTSLVSSAAAGRSKSHLGTECAVVLLEPKKELETEAQGGSPVVQVKEDLCPISGENPTVLVVDKGVPWEKPIQPWREEAQSPLEKEKHQVHRIKDSGDSHDDSEDTDLQATQCFVKLETQSLEADQSIEDEATQAYLLTLPHEPGPSCCSMQAQGALDESWEVLATQPFCPRESEAPESQPAAAFPGSCLSLPGIAPQDQHPESLVPTQPLEIKDRGMQTVEDLGHFSCQIPPSEETSRDDQESPDTSLPSAVPESSAIAHQKPFIFHKQKHTDPQTVLSLPSPLERPVPRTRQKRSQKAPVTPLSSELKHLHTKPKVKAQESPRVTPPPVSSLALEPHSTTPKDQPVTSETTPRVTRGRARRSSVKTPELGVPAAPELQSSASTEQHIVSKPTSQATRSRTLRSSVKTPEAGVVTASELQSSHTIDQSVTPESTSHTTWSRTRRSSVKTPEPVVLTTPELQPSVCENQPVTPKLTVRVTRSKGHASSSKVLEPVVPTAPEHQLDTPTDQAVTAEPISWATRGRASKSLETPIPFVPIAPENRPCTPTVIPEPVFHATRGRTRSSSVKTPDPVPPASRIQPTVRIEQLVPLGVAQGRTRKSNKTPKPANLPNPELQSSTSTDQPVIPEPLSRTTRGTSVTTSQFPEPTFLDLELNPTDQSVIPETKVQDGQGKRLRSSVSAATSESQSPAPKPTPQANCSRKARATRKHGSLAVTVVHEVSPVPPEPHPQSSRSQRRAVRTAKSLEAKPEPVTAQPPETPTHAPEVQKIEATQRPGHSPEARPKATQSKKRPVATVDSSPLQKRLQREVPQKITFLKEEEEDPAEKLGKEEDVVIPGASKRKRAQAEEEPEGRAKRSLRRAKPTPDSTAPKVLFTGVVDERGKRALLDLGGSLANSVAEASYLVTDRIRRTVKFLCALGRGIPILSLDWLYQSSKARRFLPPDDYVVMDPEHEKNFGFSLKESLSRAQERRLLEGYEIHVTPGVQPPPAEMGEIISCCGGTLLTSMPRAYKPQRVVITCSQDFHRCSVPFRVGLPILSPEFLLTGVLKQEAKPEAFIFSALEMSPT